MLVCMLLAPLVMLIEDCAVELIPVLMAVDMPVMVTDIEPLMEDPDAAAPEKGLVFGEASRPPTEAEAWKEGDSKHGVALFAEVQRRSRRFRASCRMPDTFAAWVWRLAPLRNWR